MRSISLSLVALLLSASTVYADHHHKHWVSFLAGKWVWEGGSGGGEMEWKLAANKNALIGESKGSDGQESAWITGWNPKEKRLVISWFGAGTHGKTSYEVIDDETLRGPLVLHGEGGTTKATVTMKKTGPKRFTVHWKNVTLNGDAVDDINLVVERK